MCLPERRYSGWRSVYFAVITLESRPGPAMPRSTGGAGAWTMTSQRRGAIAISIA